jgi:hypothetical protein
MRSWAVRPVRAAFGVARQPQPLVSPFSSASRAISRTVEHEHRHSIRLSLGSAPIAVQAPKVWPGSTGNIVAPFNSAGYVTDALMRDCPKGGGDERTRTVGAEDSKAKRREPAVPENEGRPERSGLFCCQAASPRSLVERCVLDSNQGITSRRHR